MQAASYRSPEEQLTEQFYAWEVRGRGWQIWDVPVELEPPFRPFIRRGPRYGHPAYDDGRRPTFFSRIADHVKDAIRHKPPLQSSMGEPDDEPAAEEFADDNPLVELQIALPQDAKISRDLTVQFLLSLGTLQRPLSFEIVGDARRIGVQMACGERDQTRVRQQVAAYFPDAVATEPREKLAKALDTAQSTSAIVEIGLSDEFVRPITTFKTFEPDPLAGLIGAMGDLARGETAVLQVLLTPVQNPWPDHIMRAVMSDSGEPFFADDPAMTSLAGRKIAEPLFAVVVRIAGFSQTPELAWEIAESLFGFFNQYTDPVSNRFIPLSNDGYDHADHCHDLLLRRSRRSGMLLNVDELASLVHLPSSFIRAEKLTREVEKTKAAPAIASGYPLLLGENVHAGKTTQVTLSHTERLRHTFVIGASGTGKSTLLLNLIAQDLRNGEGIGVLDPHGDLIDQILGLVPEDRMADVIVIDPADTEHPVSFNILSAHSDIERNLLASDLVSVFRRLSTSWGDQMNTVFGNAILAFLESSEGGSLSDLRRFLVEKEYRDRFLLTVRDPEIVYYWQKEFPLLVGRPQGPILTRLDGFLRPKMIRNMVSQRENRLDFAEIMNGKKILLAKLSQGLIGEENSYLLGTLLVSKLNQMAMSRQDVEATKRPPFYLYIDEFHNFVTPSLAAILSGARKYGLGLILAHQELHQLWSRDASVASAVISNPFTRICFRLGDLDAKKLAEGFASFDAKDLQQLGIGQAICRLERADWDFNLRTVPFPAPLEGSIDRKQKIIELSRRRYAARSTSTSEPAVVAVPPAAPHIPEVTPAPVVPTIVPTTVVPSPGRGGRQHKYLQDLIRRWAESRDYRVTIEKPILGGLGSVDVTLEKGDTAIACEISITTSVEHEVGNLQKCVAAGFTHVIAVGSDPKALKKLAKAAGQIDGIEPSRVSFFMPEELFAFLSKQDAAHPEAEKTVRGYKVKVKVNEPTDADQKLKSRAIAQTVLSAMRRLKAKKD